MDILFSLYDLLLQCLSIAYYSSTLPVRKVQGLGGKFGEKLCEDLNIKFMGDLVQFSKEELQRRYDERNGQWLYNICRGIDLEIVTPRLVSKSIGCCKKFPGRNAITAISTLTHWLHELAKEISERLEQDEVENNRRPKQMVVSYIQGINNTDVSSSRTINLSSIDEDKLVNDALDVLKKNTDKFFKSPDNLTILNNPIKFLGLNVGKFENIESKRGNTIQDMFQRNIESKKNDTTVLENNESSTSENAPHTNEPSASTSTAENQKVKKESFFEKYHREQRELREAEAAKLLEQQNREKEQKSADDDNHSKDEENLFEDDLLMAEIEANNQSIQISSRTETDSPVPSTSSKPDYKQTYAEFYLPNAELNLPKVQCEQCDQKVFEHELQVHTDGHLAFQLNQEQRNEFQSQLKRTNPQPSQTSNPSKKMKTQTSTKVQTPVNKITIQKFLVKPSETEQMSNVDADTKENIETEKCSECGKNIAITELFEHMDFHAAQKLHRELLQAERATSQLNNNAVKNSPKLNGVVGKAKASKKKVSSESGPKRNIASFFQNA